VRYLDIGGVFKESESALKPGLYNSDQLHLVKKGYEVMAEQIEPLLSELLKQ
jgi:lysophospholipase L1-like esterase